FATASNTHEGILFSAPPDARLEELQPRQRQNSEYLQALGVLWFEKNLALDAPEGSPEYYGACVELGRLLHCHAAFIKLLKAAYERVNIAELAQEWQRDYSLPNA